MLGSLLFLLYINEMTNHVRAESLTLFADDTTAAVSAESPEELKNKIEMAVSDFREWCWKN